MIATEPCLAQALAIANSTTPPARETAPSSGTFAPRLRLASGPSPTLSLAMTPLMVGPGHTLRPEDHPQSVSNLDVKGNGVSSRREGGHWPRRQGCLGVLQAKRQHNWPVVSPPPEGSPSAAISKKSKLPDAPDLQVDLACKHAPPFGFGPTSWRRMLRKDPLAIAV